MKTQGQISTAGGVSDLDLAQAGATSMQFDQHQLYLTALSATHGSCHLLSRLFVTWVAYFQDSMLQ